jgi:hypothetical protein
VVSKSFLVKASWSDGSTLPAPKSRRKKAFAAALPHKFRRAGLRKIGHGFCGDADKVPVLLYVQLGWDHGHMRHLLLLLFLYRLSFPGFSAAADLYKWVDAEGTVHMTDTLSQVPPQYRDQVDKKNLESPADVSSSPKAHSLRTGRDALKHIEVRFQAFEGRSRRIIIPVIFNESIEARLLLDTGSPGLMISPALAKRLGLLDERETRLRVMTGGIGGAMPAVLAVVDTVRVGEASADFLPATITQIPSDEFEGLVGMDFMSNYRISLDVKNNLLSFDELPPQADRPGGHDETWWRSNFHTFEKLKDQWADYRKTLDKEDLTTSEKERRAKIVRDQYEAADKLCRKLERYARENAVPVEWRR